METERLPLKELIPYDRNAKKHPQYHVDQIKRSIEQFGNIDPIAIDSCVAMRPILNMWRSC